MLTHCTIICRAELIVHEQLHIGTKRTTRTKTSTYYCQHKYTSYRNKMNGTANKTKPTANETRPTAFFNKDGIVLLPESFFYGGGKSVSQECVDKNFYLLPHLHGHYQDVIPEMNDETRSLMEAIMKHIHIKLRKVGRQAYEAKLISIFQNDDTLGGDKITTIEHVIEHIKSEMKLLEGGTLSEAQATMEKIKDKCFGFLKDPSFKKDELYPRIIASGKEDTPNWTIEHNPKGKYQGRPHVFFSVALQGVNSLRKKINGMLEWNGTSVTKKKLKNRYSVKTDHGKDYYLSVDKDQEQVKNLDSTPDMSKLKQCYENKNDTALGELADSLLGKAARSGVNLEACLDLVKTRHKDMESAANSFVENDMGMDAKGIELSQNPGNGSANNGGQFPTDDSSNHFLGHHAYADNFGRFPSDDNPHGSYMNHLGNSNHSFQFQRPPYSQFHDFIPQQLNTSMNHPMQHPHMAQGGNDFIPQQHNTHMNHPMQHPHTSQMGNTELFSNSKDDDSWLESITSPAKFKPNRNVPSRGLNATVSTKTPESDDGDNSSDESDVEENIKQRPNLVDDDSVDNDDDDDDDDDESIPSTHGIPVKITDSRKRRGRLQYYVHWEPTKGKDHDPSWQPARNISQFKKIIKKFNEEKAKRAEKAAAKRKKAREKAAAKRKKAREESAVST